MSFEPVYLSQSCEVEKRVCSLQTTVEGKTSAPLNIKRVLQAHAEISNVDAQAVGGEVRIEGELRISVLYVDEVDEVACLQHTADFSDRERRDVDCGSLSCNSRVVSCEVDSLGNELEFSVGIECEVFGSKQEKIEYLSPLISGAYAKDAHQPFVTVIGRGSYTLECEKEIELDLNEICCAWAECEIVDKSSSVDCISLKGEITACITGKSNGKIKREIVSLPFEEEIGVSGASLTGSVRVSVVGARVEVNRQGDSSVYAVNARLNVEYCVYSDGEFNYLSDAFSVKNELLCTTQSYEVCTFVSSYCMSDRVDWTVALAGDEACDSVICTNVVPIVASCRSYGGEVVVEGVISGEVLCEGDGVIFAKPVSCPFVTSGKLPVVGGEEVRVCNQLSTATVRLRRGNELEIKAELTFDLFLSRSSEIAVISRIAEGEEKPKPSCAFTVYLPSKGETAWDVARKTNCSVEELCSQNEFLGEAKGGEKLIVYRGGAK